MRVELRTGGVICIEALVRWEHRTPGLLAPGKFICLAEESGTIAELGDWVLRTACRDAIRLRQTGFALRSVAINLSARQFELPDLAKRVGLILLSAMGISTALDDFGTGYSSLGWLQQFPLNSSTMIL